MENKEDIFDGRHYVTAQVIIKADDFAREMLGDNPEPHKIEKFILDNASLMDIVYGTPKIVHKDKVCPEFQHVLDPLIETLITIKSDTSFLVHNAHESLIETLTKRPWWKRILGL